jgi:hypothetical protein
MWLTDYPENVVKDQVRDGLSRDLAQEWVKVNRGD